MRCLVAGLALAQAAAGARVMARLIATARGSRIRRRTEPLDPAETVSVLVPVLNEERRLGPCLDGLMAQGDEVAEIIVIDGGSTDSTRELVRSCADRDRRIRLVAAGSPPNEVNGKAWGLQIGADQTSFETRWLLTIDADVRPRAFLARSLVAHAAQEGVTALSVATRQCLSGAAEGLIHPALLATLVYRFGIPGYATTDTRRVQANGQCFLIRRETLAAAGGFGAFVHSICEDVTLARAVAKSGRPTGFYETDDLVAVEMYADWRDAWENWTRSLPMTDRFTRRTMPGLTDLLLVQAAPPLLAGFARLWLGARHPLTIVNSALVICRIGVLAGMARAYEARPWTYWLSPLADGPAVVRIWQTSRQTRHRWRGRPIAAGEWT
jgi:dolichol-phosphate mannosyltransferase